MLTKRDVENVITDARESENEYPDWHYWRKKAFFHAWMTDDGEWLLQVSHTNNSISIGSVSTEGFKSFITDYSDERLGYGFTILCIRNPAKAYKCLLEQDGAAMINVDTEGIE